jgi:hypothetical protein
MGCTGSNSYDSAFGSKSDKGPLEFSPALQVGKQSSPAGSARQLSTDSVGPGEVTRMSSTERFSSNPPKRKVGFLMKQGHHVKNWKRRFFVLYQGKLTYYADRCKRERDSGVDEKGKLNLHDYVVIKGFTGTNNRTILLSHKKSPEKDYIIEAPSPEERVEWEHAISVHVKYAVFLLAQKEKGYEAFATIH